MLKFFNILRGVLNSAAGRGLTSCVMLFSSFLAPISAFPTLEPYVRHGRAKAFSSLVFGLAISVIWGGMAGGILYACIVGVATILVGEMIKRGCSIPRMILYSGMFAVFCIIVAGTFVNLAYSVDPLVFLGGKIDSLLTLAQSTYPGPLKTTLLETGLTQKELSMLVAVKLPGIVVAGWVMFLFVNTIFVAKFDYRANAFFMDDNLSKFKTSDFMVIPTILFGALYIYSISSYNDSKLVESVSAMMIATFLSVYFLQGLLIAFLLVKRIFSSSFWATMCVIFLGVMGYTVMAGVGFFDTWFDFRKYFLNKEKKGE